METIYTPILIKRSSKYGNNYWESYSQKLNRNVRLFSDLEYDHWVLIETNPTVLTFCEQPLEIEYFYNGDIAKSIPDMWVQYKDDSQCFIEIKYSKDLSSKSKNFERTNRQINIQRSYCNELGIKHNVCTEKEIRSDGILLSNMKMLLPYIKNRVCPIDSDKKRVMDVIRFNGNKATIGMIHTSINDIESVRIRESIFYLLYQGIIFGNLDKIPYSKNTEVWFNDYKTINRNNEYR